MSFGNAARVAPFGSKTSKERQKTANPVLQSSIEYDEFLQAKLIGTRSSSTSGRMMHNPLERMSMRISNDEGLSPTSHARPAWSTIERDVIKPTTASGYDDYEHKRDFLCEERHNVPMQHSWRRHVTPKRSQRDDCNHPNVDFQRVPGSSAEVAELMSAAQDSINQSRQREGIIAGLLKEGSGVKLECLDDSRHYEQQEHGNVIINDEEEPFRLTKVRRHVLARTWTRLRKSIQHSKHQRVEALQQGHQHALQRRYIRSWRASVKVAAAETQLRYKFLGRSINRWRSVLNDKRKRASRMEAAEAVRRDTHEAQALSLLRAQVEGTRKNALKEQKNEAAGTAAAAVYRRQLLRNAFGGLRSAALVETGQRELEEESSQRRLRIAALMGALATKSTPPRRADAKSSRYSEGSRCSQRDKKSNSRISVSPRLESKKERSALHMSPRHVVLPLGVPVAAESKFNFPDIEVDSKYQEKGFEINEAKMTSTRKNKANCCKLESKPLKADNTAPVKATATAKKIVNRSTVPQTLSQEDLDERALVRRVRAAELAATARSRVAKTRELENQRKQRLKQREEELFDLHQEEYRRNQLSTKDGIEDRAREEAEMKRKSKLASAHRTNALLSRWGIGPWQRLMVQARLNWAKAMNYRDDTLLQQSWISLYGYCMSVRTERTRHEYRQSIMAIVHYRRGLMHDMWKKWVLHRRLIRAKAKAVTGHFSRYTVNRRTFGAWRVALERLRRWEVQQSRAVQPMGQRTIKRHFWIKWLAYHNDALLEREIASRSNLQWQKIQGWLT